MKLRIVRTQDRQRITDVIEFPDLNEAAYAALGRLVFAGLGGGPCEGWAESDLEHLAHGSCGDTVTVERLSELGGMPALADGEPMVPDIGGRELLRAGPLGMRLGHREPSLLARVG